MNSSWQLKKFGECAELIRDTCRPDDVKASPYIGLEHIEEGTLRLLEIGNTDDVISTKSRFGPGDILFGKLRPYFRKVVRPGFSGVCSTDIWVVRSKHGTVQGYLFYWMASQEFVDSATQASEGTKMPRAKWDFLERIEKPVPSLCEQRAIAQILGTLDDKIELNRQMSKTLETITQALFKSWFVDFEPFRDQGMQNSPLGEIPMGWGVGKISDIATLNRESINLSDYPNEVFDHYSIPAFDGGHMPKAEKGDQIKSNKFRVQLEAVLISKLNPRFPRIWLPFDNGSHRPVCSTEFLVVTPKENMGREYLYSLFSSNSFQTTFSTLVTGTSSSHQRVKPEDLMAMDVNIPPEDITTSFSNKVRPLLTSINHNFVQNGTIARIRDALLPKLLSGEIRLKDAEKFVEEVEK